MLLVAISCPHASHFFYWFIKRSEGRVLGFLLNLIFSVCLSQGGIHGDQQ